MKYLIIYKIIILTSFPTYPKVETIFDETYDKQQAIYFYNYVKQNTDEVRLDSVPSRKKCHKSDIFVNFEQNLQPITYLREQ